MSLVQYHPGIKCEGLTWVHFNNFLKNQTRNMQISNSPLMGVDHITKKCVSIFRRPEPRRHCGDLSGSTSINYNGDSSFQVLS